MFLRPLNRFVRGLSTQAEVFQDTLKITFPNGRQSSFLTVWLRDHCREPVSFHPDTRQRLVDTSLIPQGLRPTKVEAVAAGLRVTWPDSNPAPAYTSFYPWSFLLEHAYDPPLRHTEPACKKVLWTAKEMESQPPTVEYEDVMTTEKGVYKWLRNIDIYGFSFVNGVPPSPEETERLIRRIAFIRETHYGGFWDFTDNLQHGDLAYSTVPLKAHTDTTYFTDPCGLQLFHLLSPLSTHTGGHNLLVDGFKAASIFKARFPEYYELFCAVGVPSHASGKGSATIPSGVHLRPLVTRPVFNFGDDGHLVQVRWNADDRDTLSFSGHSMREFYMAIYEWETILKSKELELWTQMVPGQAVIFDNNRVLHGRSAYSGKRRLCGAYVNYDDYLSRLRGLAKQFGPQESCVPLLAEFGLPVVKIEGEASDAWSGYI